MPNALSELKDWVRGVTRAEAKVPQWSPISPERIEAPPDHQPLRVNEDYFRVRVHRIHLRYEKEWLEKYAPVVLVATEFSYGGEDITRPTVIGPGMIDSLGWEAPLATTIEGSVVAGPHPVQAEGIAVSVVLARMSRGNVATDFLDVIEGASGALDLVAGLGPYTALAQVVVKGMRAVTGGDQTLVARRDEFTSVVPSYYALVAPSAKVDLKKLWVRNGELMHEKDNGLEPFRDGDYVLYSVERAPLEEVDITRLPLHKEWLSVLDGANKASTPELWEVARGRLISLVGMAFASPDLTYAHAEQLQDEWAKKAVTRRDAARKVGAMGGPATDIDKRSLAILKL